MSTALKKQEEISALIKDSAADIPKNQQEKIHFPLNDSPLKRAI